jgi:hypothetical protein
MEKMRKGTGLADLEKQLKKWMAAAGNEAEQHRTLKQFLEAGIPLPIRQVRADKSWEDTQGESNGL